MFFSYINQTSNDQNSKKHFHPLKLSRLLQEGKMGGGGRRNFEAPREVILSVVEMVINLVSGIYVPIYFRIPPIAGGKTSHPQYSQQLIDPWHDPWPS